jgi:recombinational DNA repair ATPase RecF
MEIQNAYKQKMSAQLKEWGAQIDLMEAKAANVGADVEVKRAEELFELRAKLQTASQKMNEFEKTSGEAWEEVKVTADKIWEDLKAGVAAAHSKFK